MTITVTTRLDRKYLLAGTEMTNPYTEARLYNGTEPSLYLVSEDGKTAILCDAIVSIEL